jgi:subtilisin family serine protease
MSLLGFGSKPSPSRRADDRAFRKARTALACRVERLEDRTLLSLPAGQGNGVGLISPAWFERLDRAAVGAAAPGQDTRTITWEGRSTEVRKDEWLVQLGNAAISQVTSVAAASRLFSNSPFPVQVVGGLGMAGSLLVRTPGTAVDAAKNWFRSQRSIASIEPNAVVRATATPNDPGYPQLWGLNNTGRTGGTPDADIDAPEAWGLTTGSRSIVVAVIDTGVDYNHPDLAANIWTNRGEISGNGIDDDRNGFTDDVHGVNFLINGDDPLNKRGDPMDDNGHGTHVAGIIAAAGDNGIGVIGVSRTSSIMALKFLGADGSGNSADAVRAVNYATMMRTTYGVDVRLTNNSWDDGGSSVLLRNAIAESGRAGLLFIAAAGNGGADRIGDNNDQFPVYPAGYELDNIVSVAATDRNDRLAPYSNFGANRVHLAAPGGDNSPTPNGWYSDRNILSTYPVRLDTRDGIQDGYTFMAGTSMAAPHVSGVAALAWSLNPLATPEEIRNALLGGVDHVPSLAGKVATGGRLNARRTLELVPAPPPGGQIVGQGDVNGDGRDDIIRFDPASYNVYFALSLGNAFSPVQKWYGLFANSTDTFDMGDANGDGRDDIIRFARQGRDVYVALSRGSTFDPFQKWHGAFPSDGTPSVGDINGDGKDDIILFARQGRDVYAALSLGNSFGDVRKWHGAF